MSDPLDHYREIWLCDFEFRAPAGERPQPLCLVVREYRSGRLLRLWAEELEIEFLSPFDTGADALFVAYYASAELGCFQALGWPFPSRILDLFCEFRCITNGLPVPCGNSLLGALTYFGLDGIDSAEKDAFRELAMRGGRYTGEEKTALLYYCRTDVDALAKLLPAMLPQIDLPRALLRGRYMAAAARIEWFGVPIDTDLLERLRNDWEAVKNKLTREIDQSYGVYVPNGITINPASPWGAALLQTAADYEIEPAVLAVAAEQLWREERQARAEHENALRAARKATGLTSRRIGQWEDAGRDHSSFPHWDETARSLAAELPGLGIGHGYAATDNVDDADYAGDLWQLLREPAQTATPKHDFALLRRAADLVCKNDAGCWSGPLSFSACKFADWLVAQDIPWPRRDSGVLALDDDTFRQMVKSYPVLAPLRELRHALSEMRLFDLAVGSDGRNRCLLSAFRSITGRNQPSNARFIFGPSVWLRSLIRPEPGRAVAYVDWSQQEFGIAASLSGDAAMMEAYSSGDPYLTFAKQARAVPADATKQSHAAERERFKVCALAVQYGMGAASLAQSLGQPEAYARELLQLHQETYARFWRWSQSAVDHALLRNRLWTVFGWQVQVGGNVNPRSLANFLMQANGAEMLRLACCLTTEREIRVCAPVHDALLIEDEADLIDSTVLATQAAMCEAAEIVLGGFVLRSDAKIVRYPERFSDPRGARMFATVSRLLDELEPAPNPDRSEIPPPAPIPYGYLRRSHTPVHSSFSF